MTDSTTKPQNFKAIPPRSAAEIARIKAELAERAPDRNGATLFGRLDERA